MVDTNLYPLSRITRLFISVGGYSANLRVTERVAVPLVKRPFYQCSCVIYVLLTAGTFYICFAVDNAWFFPPKYPKLFIVRVSHACTTNGRNVFINGMKNRVV